MTASCLSTMPCALNVTMEKSKKLTSKDIKAKTKAIINDRKNANNLVDILACAECADEEVLLACVRSFSTVFSLLISQQEMYFDTPPSDDDLQEECRQLADLTAEEKYKLWLRERYVEARSKLLQLLTHENYHIQELSLCTLMKLVESEAVTPLRRVSAKHVTFPTSYFEDILKVLLSSENDTAVLLKRFQEFLEYDDVRYYAMKYCLMELKPKDAQDKNKLSNAFTNNMFQLLENLSMPKPAESEHLEKFMSKLPENTGNLKLNTYKEHKKLFTTMWLEFLKLKLPTSLYKKVLLDLADKVIPHMTSPLLLADFLTASYNIGGAISLLALNGLFILVHSFNLDYPDFFKKLYGLFEPNIFHVKYRARFFFLTDLFLTSTHLPAYLVAAFIKRLARLLLTAPPSGVTVALPFIYNLLKRHPECKALIHRAEPVQGLSTDPYNMDEPDPAKCNALESSLWEIKTLQEHYHHSIASEAKKINAPIGDLETNISELLETSVDDMFKSEMKKKLKTVPVTFEPPAGLFGSKDDRFSEIWELD